MGDEGDERLGHDDGIPRMVNRRRPGQRARDPVADDVYADEREASDRDFSEDRELTDDERLELFRDSMQQSVLPDLPPMPGYHVFWATTSNPRDSIQWRMRIGYELIRLSDCPGWEGVGVSAGGVEGVIGVNEMVAMRIKLSLYNKYMNLVHHRLPLAEEEKIAAQTDEFKEKAARRGAPVVEIGDGTANLVQRGQAPVFAQ